MPTWQDGSPTLVFNLGRNEIGVCSGESMVCKTFNIGLHMWTQLTSLPFPRHPGLKAYLDLGDIKVVFGAGNPHWEIYYVAGCKLS